MISSQTQKENKFSYLILPANKMYAVITKEKPAENLLNLLQQKSEKGFSKLYDNYADALFSVIYRIVEKRVIAEDLLQDSFVKIWQKIDTYDETKGTLFTWMLNIARNTSIDHIRLRKNEFNKKLLHDDILLNEYFHPCIDLGNANRLDYISIKNIAAALDDKYAIILDLIYFEGCTYEQVAKLLKLPLGTVKTRGRMALTLLKKRI
jgi:RNA polymerase sigma-70 factor (ECF subfamily)